METEGHRAQSIPSRQVQSIAAITEPSQPTVNDETLMLHSTKPVCKLESCGRLSGNCAHSCVMGFKREVSWFGHEL